MKIHFCKFILVQQFYITAVSGNNISLGWPRDLIGSFLLIRSLAVHVTELCKSVFEYLVIIVLSHYHTIPSAEITLPVITQ